MSRLLLSCFFLAKLANSQGTAMGPANTILSGPTLPAKCAPAANNIFVQTAGGPVGSVYWCDSTNHWSLLGGSGTGSIAPASSGGCNVVRTSATVLTIFPGASSSLQCSFPVGNNIYSFTSPATATISSGSDTAYIYISDSGTLTVGTASQSVTCSGCTSLTGISAFPNTSTPVYTWASVSGAWATSGTDRRTGGGRGASLTQSCDIVIGSMSGSALADTDDVPYVCSNKSGQAKTITAVECRADAGSPTVTPIITGGSGTSILNSALTCGNGSFASGTLNGSPSLANNGSIDGNITSAGGTAKYLVIRITAK